MTLTHITGTIWKTQDGYFSKQPISREMETPVFRICSLDIFFRKKASAPAFPLYFLSEHMQTINELMPWPRNCSVLHSGLLVYYIAGTQPWPPSFLGYQQGTNHKWNGMSWTMNKTRQVPCYDTSCGHIYFIVKHLQQLLFFEVSSIDCWVRQPLKTCIAPNAFQVFVRGVSPLDTSHPA